MTSKGPSLREMVRKVCVARTWSALLTTLCNVNRVPMRSVRPRSEGDHSSPARQSGRSGRIPGRAYPQKLLLPDSLRAARRRVTCDHGDDRKANHSGELLRRFAPPVAMVQAAEPRHGGYVCGRRGFPLDRSFVRGVLFQRVMYTVLMVIAHIITHEPE
jgi:hypothetical protein